MRTKGILKYSSFAMFLLICVILFTLSQVNNAKSKYQAQSNGTSLTSVARWNVSVTPVTVDNVFNMVAGNSLPVDYTVRVTNNSEVASSYSIIVSNIPEGARVLLDGETEGNIENRMVTFTNAGAFGAGDANTYNDHTLTFITPLETNAVTNNSIDIQVLFTQED